MSNGTNFAKVRNTLTQKNFRAKLPPLDPGKLPPAYFDLKLSKRKGPSAVRDVEAEKLDQVSQSIAAPEPAKSSLPQRKKDGTLMTKKEMKAVCFANIPSYFYLRL